MKRYLYATVKAVLGCVNFYVPVRLNGKWVKIPVVNLVGITHLKVSGFETFMNAVIRDFYTGGVFLDVGVNVGQTLLKFKTIYPSGEYFGFEPNPNCLFYLYRLISLNRWTQCTVVPAGLAESNKFARLFLNAPDIKSIQASATFVQDYRISTSIDPGLVLPCIRLDDYIDSFFSDIKISLVKIDIEGGELAALEGMSQLIRRDFPIIIVESLPANRENGELRKKLLRGLNDLVRHLGYSVSRVIEGEQNYSLENINEIPEDKSDLNNYNYLLVPMKN